MKSRYSIHRVALLVALAVWWSILAFIISVTAPIGSKATTISSSSPAARISSPSPTVSAVSPSAVVFTQAPRETILKIEGYQTVGLLSGLPLAFALAVGVLLRVRLIWGWRWAGYFAWAISAAVLLGGLIGFVTFLIGILVVPTGALLIGACNVAAPLRARQVRTNHP